MPNPLVSVVMVVYNDGDGLPATIESLHAQTFHDFELIVIDDASTDHTWNYLSHLEFPRLRVHRNATNKGQPVSLNLALGMAQGKYVARHNAADASLPSRFEEQVAFLDNHTGVALVGTQVDLVSATGELMCHFEYPTDHEAIIEHLQTQEGSHFGYGTTMARLDALKEVSLYREAFRLAQDCDLVLRTAEKFRITNLAKTHYRARFCAQMTGVRRKAELDAYVKLAWRLAAEQAEQGRELTDVNTAGADIEERYAQMSLIARQIERATNFIDWAEQLVRWGEPAVRHAWGVWTHALTTWPFIPRVWLFAARQILRSRQRETSQPE